MVIFSMTLVDPASFQGHSIFEVEYLRQSYYRIVSSGTTFNDLE